jgi:hypothetical protein
VEKPAYDLLIKGGTLVDTAQGLNARRDTAFAGGLVAAIGDDIPASQAESIVDASGRLVVPGMIDLHVHVFEGVSFLGVAPDPTCLARGVTTVVDAGSAGADTFPGFRQLSWPKKPSAQGSAGQPDSPKGLFILSGGYSNGCAFSASTGPNHNQRPETVTAER